MKGESINKDDLALELARELELPKVRARELIAAIEEEIITGLKRAERVQLKDFGTFYILNRKSRRISQIRTGQSRLLLERRALKFRAAEEFKNTLAGRAPRQGARFAAAPARRARQAVKRAAPTPKLEPKTVPIHRLKPAAAPPTAPAPQKKHRPFNFQKPLIVARHNRETIRRKIAKRLIELAKKSKVPASPAVSHPHNLGLTPEGTLFAALIQKTKLSGIDAIHFDVSDAEKTTIFHSRPRAVLTRLPTPIVKTFLKKHLEMQEFELPQIRFISVTCAGKIKRGQRLVISSLPTVSGAAIHLKIL